MGRAHGARRGGWSDDGRRDGREHDRDGHAQAHRNDERRPASAAAHGALGGCADGVLDVAVAHFQSENVTVWLGRSPEEQKARQALAGR
ncbi:MAG: hypothetical protein ABIO65_02795 [Nitrospiria bacterium]